MIRRWFMAWCCAAMLARAEVSRPPAGSAAPTPASEAPQKIDAVNVTDQRYRAVPLDAPFQRLGLLGLSLGPPPDFVTQLKAMVVTAARTPQPAERVAATTRILDGEAIRTAPTATLDSALRLLPTFSLFRRSDSLTANPTTQGVSLRGLGPSGASRSLVLLDGVPLNDPFGGWVDWAQIPRDAVARIEVVPGGGATVWGNSDLGGVVQVLLTPPRTEAVVIDRPPAPISWGSRGTAQLTALAGDFGTRSGSVIVNRPAGAHGVVELRAEDFSTDGFNTVAPERRGSIDVNAWSRHRSFGARWREALGPAAEITVTARGFEEFRGNGTPYQRNGTRAKFTSVQAAGQPGDRFSWNAAAYAQEQTYASTFSAINATRTAETPASDQFAVPATALGANWAGSWKPNADATTTFGIDLRTVHGETRENYSYSAGDFTRQRIAGGTQEFGGLFGLGQFIVARSVQFTAGARIDRWSDGNGHRRELLRASGVLTRDDAYPDRKGAEVSPSVGLIWTPLPTWHLKADAQHAFRRPTLNELYRPFRQGATVVEANENLRTEHVDSAECGVEWNSGPTAELPRNADARHSLPPALPPRPRLTLGATAFWNDLHDAVTNVTLAKGPGTFPLFGPLPAGGIGRQRLNIDQVRVQGLELSATWAPAASLAIVASYQYDEAIVRRASLAPALVGRQLPEVPRHSAAVGAVYHAPARITLSPRVRWIGRQFDDDENTLRLAEAVVADAGLSRPLSWNLELFVTLENVTNTRVETARSADGVVNLGTPRLLLAGVRGKW